MLYKPHGFFGLSCHIPTEEFCLSIFLFSGEVERSDVYKKVNFWNFTIYFLLKFSINS